MKVVAIIQARMGSSRLPGKVMLILEGRSVLAHVIERVMGCRLLDDVVVATTSSSQDHVVADEAARCGAKVFRGSEHDVLSRYYEAAVASQAEIVMRITSDCPLHDSKVLEQLLRAFLAENSSGQPCDYLSNTRERTYPRGLDTEIFTFSALQKAYYEAVNSYEREHVTPYLYQHPEKFRICDYRNSHDLSAHRWTLDTPEDWRLIQCIYRDLSMSGRPVTTANVLKLLRDRPDLVKINAHIEQKVLGQ